MGIYVTLEIRTTAGNSSAVQCLFSGGPYTVASHLLAEWMYSERALFLRRSAPRLSAWRQDLRVLRRAASALAVAVLKVGRLIPARGGLTAHR